MNVKISRPKFSKTRKKWIVHVEGDKAYDFSYETRSEAEDEYKKAKAELLGGPPRVPKCDGKLSWYDKINDDFAYSIASDPSNEQNIKAARVFTQLAANKLAMHDFSELEAKVAKLEKTFAAITQAQSEGTKITAGSNKEA